MSHFLPKRPPYEHPGYKFIERYGIPVHEDDIVNYADFLREQAKAGKYPPISLRAIRWRFGIKLVIKSLPPGMSGFADHKEGSIYLRRDDLETRQQFSEAHEMIEILCGACRESQQWETSVFAKKSDQKERLCHKGAAALLMPKQAFLSYLNKVDLSLQTASSLAELCKTSLTATVHRMVNLSSKSCAMIVWHNQSTIARGASEIECENYTLQVRWAETSHGMEYIPPGQSVNNESIIWQAYETGQPQKGSEYLRLGTLVGTFLVEAKKVRLGNVRCVLSLIQPWPKANMEQH